MKFSNVYVESIGYLLAPNVVTSDDLEDRLAPVYDTLRIQPGQLEALTGIRERRYWDPGFKMSAGAIEAGRRALSDAGVPASDVGMVLYTGVCRDLMEPATACAVADGLGVSGSAQIYDVSNACLGVLNGMVQVANAIEMGQIHTGIVVSCESARQIVDLTIDRMQATPTMDTFKKTVATLTGGSGAVAVLLTNGQRQRRGHQLVGGAARNDVRHHQLCTWGPDTGIPASAPMVMETDSVGVLQHGVALGAATYADFRSVLALGPDEPHKIVCHQVGAAHQRTVLESIGIPIERDFSTFAYLGNIGTVSMPITAAIAAERGFFDPGDLVGFFGIGSGLNCLLLGLRW